MGESWVPGPSGVADNMQGAIGLESGELAQKPAR